MKRTTILTAFAAYVEQSGQGLRGDVVVSRLLAAFFRGDTKIFSSDSLDGTGGDELDLVIWGACPTPGMPSFDFYPQNRMSLFDRLWSNHCLPGDVDWTALRRGKAKIPELFHRVAEELGRHPLGHATLAYANNIAISNLAAGHFLREENLTAPTSWLDGMGVSSAEDTKTGPKPGLRKQTTPCCEALDQLIALGLYHPKPRGAAAAARLIKQIVGSSLTEKGIAAAISEYHEDLVYRPNRLKRKSF